MQNDNLRRGGLLLRRGWQAAGGLRRRSDPRRLHAQGRLIGIGKTSNSAREVQGTLARAADVLYNVLGILLAFPAWLFR